MKQNILNLYVVVLLSCLSVFAAQAQNIQYKGVVVDETGEAVIGASVKVVGSAIGSITDLEGNFSIAVPKNGKVEISYLGYTTQTISDFKQTRIVMKDDMMQLDEVVVVGYGSQKKAHLTGSIATVAMDEISDLSTGGLAASLSGLINGVSVSGGDGRPGESASINIRQADIASSFSTVSGYVPESSPLYVIDGYISDETAFNNLDGTMVESISVLKDAAAAVYGARSANGVILVTTKRGQIGKPKISYNGQFGVTDELSRTKMLNSYDYGKIWNGTRAGDVTSDDTFDRLLNLFQADELEAMKKLNYDLLDREWSAAMTQKHSVNLTGGSDNANYFAGISYYNQEGNIGNLDYERWNYRAGADMKISKWLKASLQVSGDYGESQKSYSKVGGENAESDYNALLTRPRYIPEYVDGHPIAAYGVTNTKVSDTQYYHYDLIQNLNNYSKSMSQNTTINTSLEYDFGWNRIMKGLKLKMTYSKSIHTTKSNQYASNYTLYSMTERGGSGSHLYTGSDLNLDSSNFQAIQVDNGNFLRRGTTRSDNYQINFMASYERKFGDHKISGLFTIERSESETETLEGSVTDPYSFTNGQSSTANGTQTTAFSRSESGSLSYAGRINYVYADKYLFEFLVRTDASTKFAPENYWGTFPSFSAGWIMSEESWFKAHVKAIDYLKLRGSFGLLGRDGTKAWAWTEYYNLNSDKGPIFGTSTSTASGSHIGIPDTSSNRDAHWDKSYKANFGLDLGTLRNRLTVNLDAYYEWNRDIFVARDAEVPLTFGAKLAAENYGSIDTYGVELTLGWKDKIGKDFKYSARLSTGYRDNKVLKMPWASKIPIDQVHKNKRSDTGIWGLQTLGMFRSYQEIEEYFAKYGITNYLGLTKDKVRPGMLIYKDVRGPQNDDGTYQAPDGVINAEEDIVRISKRSSNPYGMTLNLKAEYKSFSFSAQIGGNWGGYVLIPKTARSVESLTSSASGYNVMQFNNMPAFWANNMFVYEDVLDDRGNVVAEANHDAKYPNLRHSVNAYNSTFWKVSSTRVTLRNITLAYALPKDLLKTLSIESCRLNFTVQNVLSFYNPYPKGYMDPMAGAYGKYPNLRKFTLGVNVAF